MRTPRCRVLTLQHFYRQHARKARTGWLQPHTHTAPDLFAPACLTHPPCLSPPYLYNATHECCSSNPCNRTHEACLRCQLTDECVTACAAGIPAAGSSGLAVRLQQAGPHGYGFLERDPLPQSTYPTVHERTPSRCCCLHKAASAVWRGSSLCRVNPQHKLLLQIAAPLAATFAESCRRSPHDLNMASKGPRNFALTTRRLFDPAHAA